METELAKNYRAEKNLDKAAPHAVEVPLHRRADRQQRAAGQLLLGEHARLLLAGVGRALGQADRVADERMAKLPGFDLVRTAADLDQPLM